MNRRGFLSSLGAAVMAVALDVLPTFGIVEANMHGFDYFIQSNLWDVSARPISETDFRRCFEEAMRYGTDPLI